MKKCKLFVVAALLLVGVLAFAACGNDPAPAPAPAPGAEAAQPAQPPPPPPVAEVPTEEVGLEVDILDELDPDHPLYNLHSIQQRFPLTARNDDPPIQGGTLFVGHNSAAPIPGVFNAIFSTSVDDSEFMLWAGVGSSIFNMEATMQMGQHGLAQFDFDIDARTITINLVEDVFWHDGVPLTLGDVTFAIEQIASPGYAEAGGIRWTSANQNIVGAWEFHRGEADHISGFTLSPDERTLTIEFIDFAPSILYFGFWTTPYPRHIFENVPIADQPTHPATRVNPIGWGPFIFENIVPGESASFVANENFVFGRPYLDAVVVQRIGSDMILPMLLNGDIDLVRLFPLPQFNDMPDPPNFQYLGDVGNFFNWVAFNLGDWDAENTQVVPYGPEARMGNINLRRAMAFAVNEQALADYLFNGLRFAATSIIPPGHSTFLDPNQRGFNYDPALAMQLLDDAGFIDVDGDGWREFPDGSELEIHFVISTFEDPNQQIVAQHYQEAWEAIGLRVWVEWVDWTAKIANMFQADNWDWDVTTAAWSAGANPDPNGLWGHTSNNRARFMNDTIYNHLQGFNSREAWDTEWLINHYHQWQQIFVDYVPAFPTNWRIALQAVNDRVQGYFIGFSDDGTRTRGGLHHIRLTAADPIRQ